MPSLQHQELVLWGVRAMLRDGFAVDGVDGEAGGVRTRRRPPVLRGVRPDAWGVNSEKGVIGFVEAKTGNDIDNAHTRQQLSMLSELRMPESGDPCPLYVVIPRAAAYALDKVLISIDLIRAPHVRRIHVPSALLGN